MLFAEYSATWSVTVKLILITILISLSACNLDGGHHLSSNHDSDILAKLSELESVSIVSYNDSRIFVVGETHDDSGDDVIKDQVEEQAEKGNFWYLAEGLRYGNKSLRGLQELAGNKVDGLEEEVSHILATLILLNRFLATHLTIARANEVLQEAPTPEDDIVVLPRLREFLFSFFHYEGMESISNSLEASTNQSNTSAKADLLGFFSEADFSSEHLIDRFVDPSSKLKFSSTDYIVEFAAALETIGLTLAENHQIPEVRKAKLRKIFSNPFESYGELVIDWRNEKFVNAISATLSKHQPKNLVAIVGRSHRPGVIVQLLRSLKGAEVTQHNIDTFLSNQRNSVLETKDKIIELRADSDPFMGPEWQKMQIDGEESDLRYLQSTIEKYSRP